VPTVGEVGCTAVLFDFGGTLDADGVPWRERFRRLFRQEGVDIAPEAFDRAFYAADDALLGAIPGSLERKIVEDLGSVDKMGGSRLTDALLRGVFGGGDWRPALGRRLGATPDARADLIAVVEDTRRALSGLVGPAAAGQLVRIAMATAGEGRGDIVAAVGLGGSA